MLYDIANNQITGSFFSRQEVFGCIERSQSFPKNRRRWFAWGGEEVFCCINRSAVSSTSPWTAADIGAMSCMNYRFELVERCKRISKIFSARSDAIASPIAAPTVGGEARSSLR